MLDLDLGFLRQAFGVTLRGSQAQAIKRGRKSQVYRLALQYRGRQTGPTCAVVKILTPPWPADSQGPDRELRLYRQVLPGMDVRRPQFYAGRVDQETGRRILLLEDLTGRYRFPSPRYTWTADELKALLRAYARLHVAGQQALRALTWRDWLLRPWHDRLESSALKRMVHDLRTWGIWSSLPGIDAFIETTVQQVPTLSLQAPTLLHNDLYPPNVALPKPPQTEAVLLDWEMASWGQPELELAYLFLQPYRSARNVARETILAYYWDQRQALESHVPPPKEREKRQQHAESVLALALVRVAHRVAQHPFPAQTPPRAYWNAMFTVLEEALHGLADAVRRRYLATMPRVWEMTEGPL